MKEKPKYLYQASVFIIVQIFEYTLFPITSQSSWRSPEAWGSLASFIPCITFGSSWTLSACGPLRSHFSWRSLWTCKALVSWLSGVALVPLWSRRTTRTGWSCDARGSRGSWAPGNTWYPWRAKRSTISIGSMRWIWVSALCLEKNTHNFCSWKNYNYFFFFFFLRSIGTNSSF